MEFSKKKAFTLPSIMAPVVKKYNINTERKKFANSYYEKVFFILNLHVLKDKNIFMIE